MSCKNSEKSFKDILQIITLFVCGQRGKEKIKLKGLLKSERYKYLKTFLVTIFFSNNLRKFYGSKSVKSIFQSRKQNCPEKLKMVDFVS
jgi:hypothetical protein